MARANTDLPLFNAIYLQILLQPPFMPAICLSLAATSIRAELPQERTRLLVSAGRSDSTEKDLAAIRYTTRTGRRFGGESFADMVVQTLNRRLTPGRAGRPKKLESS